MTDIISEFGINRLYFPLAALEIVLDTRLAILTFLKRDGDEQQLAIHPPNARSKKVCFSVRLDKFANFQDDMQEIVISNDNGRAYGVNSASQILLLSLRELTKNHESPPSEMWWTALGDFAFFLLRFSNKSDSYCKEHAIRLLTLLGAAGPNTAWRVSYDESLSFEHRYELLRQTDTPNGSGDRTSLSEKQLDLPDRKERELFWWGTRRRYEIAKEWCESESYGNPNSRHAFRESAINYLQILKDEPRQRDLNRFLSESGIAIEGEVREVLFSSNGRKQMPMRGGSRIKSLIHSPGGSTLILATDEVVRRVFFVWFLKRYNWLNARKLLFSSSKKGRLRIAAAVLIILSLMAGLLFVIQTREFSWLPKYLPFLPSADTHTPFLWMVQVFLQLSALVSVLLIAPMFFRLLMPRALFGSLLAWGTVIFAALRDLHELKMGSAEIPLTSLCHTEACTDAKAFGYSLLITLALLLLDSIFIGYTVTQFTERFRTTILRTLGTLGSLLLGSVFWALIFALPVKVALERDAFLIDCHCIIPIMFIGSSVAVLFGLIVELIWQDESLAEPLGEPL